jgi:hypothetical protein
MRRVLVVTWALGTASGVLLGLFGVQLVSSRFSTSRVSPLSHPEVVRALQAARSVPAAPEEEVALPLTSPDTAVPPPSPPIDAAPARPSAGETSSPAASPASSLPRPGATAGTLVDATAAVAATPPTTVSATPVAPEPPPTPTSATTATTAKPKSKNTGKSSTTTTTVKRSTTTTSGPTQSKASPTTISCTGGVVTVRFSDGKVELKAARPNSGYRVYVPEQNNPGEVIVYFYNNDTAYQVRAFYNYGTPDSKVTKYQWSDKRGQSVDR